jgi:hypothetical protein
MSARDIASRQRQGRLSAMHVMDFISVADTGLRRTACVQFAEKAGETAVFELAEVTVRGKEQIIQLSAV